MTQYTDITHDWEFFEDGKIIRPISCGFVKDTGEQYYAIFEDAGYWSLKTKWLAENVYPNIAEDLNKKTAFVKPKDQIKSEIIEFIRDVMDRPSLWAWYGAYDHVVMAQTIGGRMIDLPDGIPMFTNDIKTLDTLNNDTTALGVVNHLPHHALSDAIYDMDLLDAFRRKLNLNG